MTLSNSLILLVEDDENDVFFFRRALRTAGVANHLHVARDGQDAMEYLNGAGQFSDRTSYPLPGLVILDLNLPRKHGLEVLAWLRSNERFCTLPVTILTSSQSEVDLEEAYKLGANSFLVKPGGLDQLADLVKLLSDYWLGANRTAPYND